MYLNIIQMSFITASASIICLMKSVVLILWRTVTELVMLILLKINMLQKNVWTYSMYVFPCKSQTTWTRQRTELFPSQTKVIYPRSHFITLSRNIISCIKHIIWCAPHIFSCARLIILCARHNLGYPRSHFGGMPSSCWQGDHRFERNWLASQNQMMTTEIKC